VDPERTLPLGRAAFLGTIVAGAAGVVLASRFSQAVSRAVSDVAAAVGPSDGWRIYTVTGIPEFNPATYRLKIGGRVANPQDLAWSEVAALPTASQVSDFHCVTGWSVRQVHWQGIRPATLIDLARPAPDARYVTFVSMEVPYVDQLDLEQFRLADVILATSMDGRPLTSEHGAPMRLVIPDMYGYKSVKWVREIRFDARPAAGFWEQRGYDIDAWVGRSNGA
jgi:DMSO/TMAO reductase YedYZ molybdopterin-dependent catalytic subunit